MSFINPLDQVPPVPQDWANHVIYGGVLGLLCYAAFRAVQLPEATLAATVCVLVVASLKKAVDFAEEGESAAMCVGKALVTANWPASFLLFAA